jgi:hypothetical protein
MREHLSEIRYKFRFFLFFSISKKFSLKKAVQFEPGSPSLYSDEAHPTREKNLFGPGRTGWPVSRSDFRSKVTEILSRNVRRITDHKESLTM